jgi:hypothetical protein
LGTKELGDLARAAMTVLAERGEHTAFQELLSMNGHAGECLGEAARRVAAGNSWTAVAELSGTTKQAAWGRWHA